MESFSLNMTHQMEMLYGDIIASIGQLPEELRGYIFGYGDDLDMDWVYFFACYIVVEFIKYSYDYEDPEYPIRHFINDLDDSERMLQSRIMKYVLDHKKRDVAIKGGPISEDYKFEDVDMSEIENRLKGRRLTEMNFFEHQNIHNLDFIKALAERRLVSSKKISNTRFQEIFDQYDEFIESLIERSRQSDEDMVFASLAFFTLEWHFPIEFFYYLSCIMEEEDINAVDRDALALLCGFVEIESRFGGCFTTDSRMLRMRIVVTPYLFGKDTDEFGRETMLDLIKETLVLGVKYKEVISTNEGELYKEWFRKESKMEDWASFLKYYDVFSIWEKKKWTRKRIQNMRYLFDLALIPQKKNPENRS